MYFNTIRKNPGLSIFTIAVLFFLFPVWFFMPLFLIGLYFESLHAPEIVTLTVTFLSITLLASILFIPLNYYHAINRGGASKVNADQLFPKIQLKCTLMIFVSLISGFLLLLLLTDL